MPQGYSISFSGWDMSAGTSSANFNTTITLPVAKNPDGSSITGPSYEYIVTSGASANLTYAAATLDKSTARLTHRVHLDDTPVVVPASDWQYNASGTTISPSYEDASGAGPLVAVAASRSAIASSVATLTVNDPFITMQPTNRVLTPGTTAVLNVAAAGTPTLTYQWYKDNSPLSDGGRISGAQTGSFRIGRP